MSSYDENLEEDLRNICKKFTDKENNYSLVITHSNYEKFNTLLSKNGMNFAVRTSAKNCREKPRILWSSENVKYFGRPFTIQNIIQKQCVVGPQRWKKTVYTTGYPEGIQNRSKIKRSKKIGCSAAMKIVEVNTYPQFTPSSSEDKSLKGRKATALKNLKLKLQSEESVLVEREFFITLSKPCQHSHSIWTPPSETNLLVQSSCSQSTRCVNVNAQLIRELCKKIYNASFLTNADSSEDLNIIVEKLDDTYEFLNKFIEHNNNLPILPKHSDKVSELPRRKRSKKQEEVVQLNNEEDSDYNIAIEDTLYSYPDNFIF